MVNGITKLCRSKKINSQFNSLHLLSSMALLPIDLKNSNDNFKKFVMECGCQGDCQGCGSGCAGACWNNTNG